MTKLIDDDSYSFGYDAGFQDGLDDGYTKGWSDAMLEYEEQIAKLHAELVMLDARVNVLARNEGEE